MPIYEFICDRCDLRFEEILPATRVETPPCPLCQTEENVRKLVSASFRQTPAPDSGPSGCRPRSGFS